MKLFEGSLRGTDGEEVTETERNEASMIAPTFGFRFCVGESGFEISTKMLKG